MKAVRHRLTGASARPNDALEERLLNIGSRRWADWTLVGLVVLSGIGIPLGSAYATGTIGIPQNDDWAYSRIVLNLHQTGHLDLVGWNEMSLVGHLLWGLPFLELFDANLRALHLGQALAGAIGILCTFLVARHFLPDRRAAAVSALVAAFPSYALLSTSYMTDTTAFAAQMACLAVGLAALRRDGPSRNLLLAVSLVVGLFGFITREFAVAAPVAVIAGYAFRARRASHRRWASRTALPALSFAVPAALFFLWRQGLPAGQSVIEGSLDTRNVAFIVRAFFTVAFGVLPVAILWIGQATSRVMASRSLLAVGSVTGLLGMATIAAAIGQSPSSLLTGNTLTRLGSLPGEDALLGRQQPLFPLILWVLIVLSALIGGTLVAMALWYGAIQAVHRFGQSGLWSTPPAAVVLICYCAGTALLMVVRATLGGSLFERYLWGLAAALAIYLLVLLDQRPVATRWRFLAFIAFLTVAGSSLAALLEEHAFDAARWKAGAVVVARGADPRSIDAGFEWVGFHSRVDVGTSGPQRWRPPAPGYMANFSDMSNCTIVAASDLKAPALELIETRAYHTPWGDLRRLWIYRNPAACTDYYFRHRFAPLG
jgi:4-amino-4-deoxy-L-arabinose transferase-like glycosyltransferase